MEGRVPFDEKGNPEISLDDISLVLLRDHLVKTGSRLAQDVMRKPLEEILGKPPVTHVLETRA